MDIKVTYIKDKKEEEKKFKTYRKFGEWCVVNAVKINIIKVLINKNPNVWERNEIKDDRRGNK